MSQSPKDNSVEDMNNAEPPSSKKANGKSKHPSNGEFSWANNYSFDVFSQDFLASLVVTFLLFPQALAYAMLAGLPAQVGIYASIVPLAIYALIGSSRYLSVGPTAVISLMTASVISQFPEGQRMMAAMMLAFMSGGMLLLFGLLRGGFIMSFVPRPVVSAYVSGAAILIVFSQLGHIVGVNSGGSTVFERFQSLSNSLTETNMVTCLIGAVTILFLWSMRKYLAFGLYKLGARPKFARLVSRLGPLIAVIVTTISAAQFGLFEKYGVAVVGDVPKGLGQLNIPIASPDLFKTLLVPALIISIVGFIDSMSTAQTLAAQSRTHINANREMSALGAANIVASFTGGYPINGSMSRSAVNYNAGARTPVASLLTAFFMALIALFLTPLLYYLPLVTLAALIIVACFNLFDFRHLWRTYIYSPSDGLTAFATLLSVLVFGVEFGVAAGIILSMALHIRASLKPNTALVGRLPGTQHYRDADRYHVETNEFVKTLRIDESLYYANARFLEDRVAQILSNSPDMTDLILMCHAVNRIDASALNSLMSINKRLDLAGVRLHLSELHSQVSDRLKRSTFYDKLSGQVFFSQQEAIEALQPEPDWDQFDDHIDIH